MSLVDDAKQILVLPETLPVSLSQVTVTANYLAQSAAQGDPTERLEAFEFEVEALNDLLGAGFAQAFGTGSAAAQVGPSDQLSLVLTGDALVPAIVAVAVRLVIDLNHAPYDPMMEVTGAKPQLLRETLSRIFVHAEPAAKVTRHVEAASFSGLVSVPLDAGDAAFVPGAWAARLDGPILEEERLELPNVRMPETAVEEALMTISNSFVPAGQGDDDEPEFWANDQGVVIDGLRIDAGLCPALAKLFAQV